MSTQLLPLCSIPKIANRDGGVGALARLFLPFYGYWFASGQTLANTGGTIAQNHARTLGGTDKPNNFSKGVGICLRP